MIELALKALLAAALSSATAAMAQEAKTPAKGVEILDYRDWLDCYKLDNGTATAIIVPIVGARLSVFALDGKNILSEDYSVDGLDIEVGVRLEDTEWLQWDGCQPDLYRDGKHQLDQLWVAPYKPAGVAPHTASFKSAASRKHNAQVTKTFSLDEKRPRMKFEYSVANLDAQRRNWACYYRMFCKAPGFVVFPLSGKSVHESGWVFYKDEATARKQEAITKECIMENHGLLMIAPHNLRAAAYAQVFSDTDGGWVASTWNDLLLLIAYKVDKSKKYQDDCTLSVYWEPGRIALEPRGPYYSLKQGESANCDTVWTLAKLPAAIDKFEDIDGIIEVIQELVGE